MTDATAPIGAPAHVASRVAAIEGRLDQIRRGDATDGAHLGFGLVLEKQRAGITAGGLVGGAQRSFEPAAQRVPGAYGSVEPPRELLAFGNGRIPESALRPVGATGHRLWAPAAAGLEALIADAARDGVVIGVTDSYRSLADQERVAAEKGLYGQGGLAAVPGTSNHGWGLSTDLRLDERGQAWMRQNAWRYGFVEDVPREPWHWTYRPASR